MIVLVLYTEATVSIAYTAIDKWVYTSQIDIPKEYTVNVDFAIPKILC